MAKLGLENKFLWGERISNILLIAQQHFADCSLLNLYAADSNTQTDRQTDRPPHKLLLAPELRIVVLTN